MPKVALGDGTPTERRLSSGQHPSQNHDQRVIHLLSRFTFGATPAEIASVKRVGVDGWMEQQLHPERIADPILEQKLVEFPALKLPVSQLMEEFPFGGAIRQAANGKRAVPEDTVHSAIYKRQIALYEEKQAQKAAGGGGSISMIGDAEKDAALPESAYRLVDTVLSLPAEERVRRVIAMQPKEYEQFRGAMKGPQKQRLTEGLSPEQREVLADFDNPTHAVVEEQQAQRLLRDIYSSRQLQEVMTSFWLNHFNIYLHKNEQEPYYLVSYERDVIRPRALGSFEELLIAVAESPAMLEYLDNAESTGPDSQTAQKQADKQRMRESAGKAVGKNAPKGLNENYARELMELHTLGVNGGYTQKDVTEVARVFTGWTVAMPGQGGGFLFDATRHEPGPKQVLGRTIEDGGQQEGLAVLHMLANSPATAHFIAQELAIAFVSDAPPPVLVNRMARSFLASQGSVGAVLKTMVHSPEFWSPAADKAKIKTPLEYVVSAARASGAEISNVEPLVNVLNQMGMPLYGCVPPTGYAAKASDWVSTGALVARMNFALSLATNHFSGIKTNWNTVDSAHVTPELYERELEARLIPTGVSEKTRAAVLEEGLLAAPGDRTPPLKQPAGLSVPGGVAVHPPKQATDAGWQDAQMAGLLLGSPEFQKR